MSRLVRATGEHLGNFCRIGISICPHDACFTSKFIARGDPPNFDGSPPNFDVTSVRFYALKSVPKPFMACSSQETTIEGNHGSLPSFDISSLSSQSNDEQASEEL
jgi:hypothetical protein